MEDINDELKPIKDNGDLDTDLSSEGKELYNMTTARARRQPVEFSDLPKLESKKLKWVSERERAATELVELEDSIRKQLIKDEEARTTQKTDENIQIFNRLLKKNKAKSNRNNMLQRSRSNYVQFAISTLEQRKHRMRNFSNILKTLSQEFSEQSAILKEKYNLDPPGENESKVSPIAKGVFDGDIIICTDKYLVDTGQKDEEGLLFTTDTTGVRGFSSNDNKIVELV